MHSHSAKPMHFSSGVDIWIAQVEAVADAGSDAVALHTRGCVARCPTRSGGLTSDRVVQVISDVRGLWPSTRRSALPPRWSRLVCQAFCGRLRISTQIDWHCVPSTPVGIRSGARNYLTGGRHRWTGGKRGCGVRRHSDPATQCFQIDRPLGRSDAADVIPQDRHTAAVAFLAQTLKDLLSAIGIGDPAAA